MFQRIFGENQEPSEGFALDEVGTRPTAYARGGAMSEFERQIWNDFWELANDPQQQDQMGIRSNHGTVSYIQVLSGMTYQVDLRASDGLSLKVTEKKQNTSLSSAKNAQF